VSRLIPPRRPSPSRWTDHPGPPDEARAEPVGAAIDRVLGGNTSSQLSGALLDVAGTNSGTPVANLGNFVRRTSSKDAALDAVSRLITIEDCKLKYHDGVRQSEPYQALNEAASDVGPYIMIEVYDPETRSRNDASFKDWIAPHILGGASERISDMT
jgi:hypothetical protein